MRGQQIVEYALVITAISAALTAMYVYTKRGLQAVIKDTVDSEIGPQVDSATVLSVGDSQDSTSVSTTVSRDDSHNIDNELGEERQYFFDSVSGTTGTTTTISDTLKG